MAFEWVAGLFQSDNQQTRGLSGDHAHSVALDDANPYYNYRLRHHKAEGDLIADPGLLWFTSPYVKRRSGLGTHVGAEVGDGTASYTDVLLVLSREDFLRATADWQEAASRALQQEFDNFCRRESFSRLHPHRPLGVRIIEDGSQDLFGQSLTLNRGEFVTGLLPNLYTGPVRGSYPVIGVHLNLPSVWQGYQEVGRLYNDQMLFTLGNHWLDNFSHPSLQQAALYRLRQYPDGSFIHIINPDLQDQFQVTSTNQGGASVLTLATRSDGQPLAYIVLAVIDPPAQALVGSRTATPTEPRGDGMRSAPGAQRVNSPVPPPRRPDIRMPKPPPASVPSIAPPMMIDEVGGGSQKIGLGGKTIIPDAPSERILTLQERGALLQKVHFSAFMLGYDVYLGIRGELGTHVESPAATFQVRKRTVSLVSHVDGVVIDGRLIAAGVEVPIEGDVKIEVAGQKLEYHDLRTQQVDGWPYVGEIRRPASSTYVIWGEDYQVGRSRECRVVLPDEPRNDNIHWKPSVGDGATIRARTGEIPKARFYTDSIMVASEHASIDLRGETPKVVCTARHCYAYVRRNEMVQALYPTTSPQFPKEVDLLPGDEILIGNCLFQVGYTMGEAVAPAPAPKVELSREGAYVDGRSRSPEAYAETLSGAVSAPDLARLDQDTDPPSPERSRAVAPLAAQSTPAPPEVRMSDLEPMIDLEPPVLDAPTNGANGSGGGPAVPQPPPVRSDPDVPRSPPPPPEAASTSRPLGSDGWIEPRPRRRRSGAPRPAEPEPEPMRVEPDMVEPIEPDEPTAPDLERIPREGTDELDVLDRWSDEADRIDDDLPDVGGWDLQDWPEASRGGAPPQASRGGAPPQASRGGAPPAAADAVAAEVSTAERAPQLQGNLAVEDPDDIDLDLSVDSAPDELTPGEPGGLSPDETPTIPPSRAERGGVVFIDDAEAQFEIGRPLHLVLAGWMVNGEVLCGNHTGCDLRIPENRIRPDQILQAREYFRLRVRGSKGALDVLDPREVEIDGTPPAQSYDDPASHTIEVIRRDDVGERDFTVVLKLVEERRLPDPRARFVAIDTTDPLARALVTRGLPKGAPRTLSLDTVELTFQYDGATIRVSDYLETYRRGTGYHPFFVQRGDERFKTADEDGAPFDLHPGDRLVVGPCVYELRQE
jgi:hypothetical protein